MELVLNFSSTRPESSFLSFNAGICTKRPSRPAFATTTPPPCPPSRSLLTSLHHVHVPPRRRLFRLAIAHGDSPGVASLASSSATARSAVRRAGQGRPPPSSTAVTPGLRCVLAANGFLSGRGLHNAARPRPAYLPWLHPPPPPSPPPRAGGLSHLLIPARLARPASCRDRRFAQVADGRSAPPGCCVIPNPSSRPVAASSFAAPTLLFFPPTTADYDLGHGCVFVLARSSPCRLQQR